MAAAAVVGCILSATGASAGTSTNTDSHKPVSDSYITTKVKTALTKDKDTEQDARRIKGVADVHNDLMVQQSGALDPPVVFAYG